jgi:hypothetical protein
MKHDEVGVLNEAIEEYDSGDAALGVASGQLIAHLSCLAGSNDIAMTCNDCLVF